MVVSQKLIARYAELKAEAPGCLLLMQVGSFMQVIGDDARAPASASVQPAARRSKREGLREYRITNQSGRKTDRRIDMNQTNRTKIGLLLLPLLALLALAPAVAFAQVGNIDPAEHNCFSENGGWLDLRPSRGARWWHPRVLSAGLLDERGEHCGVGVAP